MTSLSAYWLLILEELDANLLARPAIRRANAGKKTRLRFYRHHHARFRHRRKHRYLQRCQCCAAQAAALRRSRPAGLDYRTSRTDSYAMGFISEFFGLA